MDQVLGLKCVLCGAEYGVDEVRYVCPNHGDEGILDVQYDYDRIARLTAQALAADRLSPSGATSRCCRCGPISLSRRWPSAGRRSTAPDGWRRALGLKHLWVKDDGRNPTASFKDRASAMAVVKATGKGGAVITTASTGNAAAALSGLCASVKQPNVIFVPQSAPPAKVAQLLVFGSTVMLVKGSYDDAFELCLLAAKEYGWYNRNTGYNPYMSEGKKTRQLRDLRAA